LNNPRGSGFAAIVLVLDDGAIDARTPTGCQSHSNAGQYQLGDFEDEDEDRFAEDEDEGNLSVFGSAGVTAA
jgi:hypothetical protein